MKKVGILTFHYADNHGAVLQAYALYKTINGFPDCEAEIINYVPKGYRYPVLSDSTMLGMQIEKRNKFNRFLSDKCGMNMPIIHSVTGNEYDIYLVGSDQIWNMDIAEAAADYEYLLPNLDPRAKRIAYSASIGMEKEKIDHKLFGQYLPRFHSISLREKSYVQVISQLAGRDCECTLDPALLLEQEDYERLMEKPDIVPDPYILYFWYDVGDCGLSSVETVNVLARKYGLLIKHTFSSKESVVRRMLVNDGGCMLQSGIGEFLWYVKNAEVIVTNSFHGALFSVLFRRPLYIYYPEIRKCRQENLADLFQLHDRVIHGYICPNELNLQTDYDRLYPTLNREREHSVSYLREAIGTDRKRG